MRNKNKERGLRRGQTIVAERERAESESERMLARKKVQRKHVISVLLVFALFLAIGSLIYVGVTSMVREKVETKTPVEKYEINAEIVDETGGGQISSRIREYIGRIERDFAALGYEVKRVVLPAGMSRTLYVDLEGMTTYFKVSLDRDTAVSAEDAKRMIDYLKEHELQPEYVDVRVQGKGYYK